MSKIIPKIIMQTAKEKPEQYIINMIHKFTPDWEYIHFIDSEIIVIIPPPEKKIFIL